MVVFELLVWWLSEGFYFVFSESCGEVSRLDLGMDQSLELGSACDERRRSSGHLLL